MTEPNVKGLDFDLLRRQREELLAERIESGGQQGESDDAFDKELDDIAASVAIPHAETPGPANPLKKSKTDLLADLRERNSSRRKFKAIGKKANKLDLRECQGGVGDAEKNDNTSEAGLSLMGPARTQLVGVYDEGNDVTIEHSTHFSGDNDEDDADIFEDAGKDYDPFEAYDLSTDSDSIVEDTNTKNDSKSSTKINSNCRADYFRSESKDTAKASGDDSLKTHEGSKFTLSDIIKETHELSAAVGIPEKKETRRLHTFSEVTADGGYDIDLDLGGEGRWSDDEDEVSRPSSKRKRRKG
ncbi:uncharacterized protein V1510DRAFT_407438 [Dipodascopsis tothii]|uniref:uncharacterized protein n=1 Tax=Dipodascopsis tothii TaxID=44089 RepID=UPI0034D00E10